jgi:hypothetical protein
VLVFPLGANSKFEEQFHTISRIDSVQMFDCIKPQYPKGYQPQFKYVDWNKGEMLFDFLRYDQAPSGPTEIEDFQSSKRILIAMGVINYPEYIAGNYGKIEHELEHFAKYVKRILKLYDFSNHFLTSHYQYRRYPNIVIKRALMFNYNFDSTSSTLRQEKEQIALEIFPPDGDCEGGSMVEVHFRQILNEVAVEIVQSLEHQMEICEEARAKGILPVNPTLVTVYDEGDDWMTLRVDISGKSSGGGSIMGSVSPGVGVGGNSNSSGNNSHLIGTGGAYSTTNTANNNNNIRSAANSNTISGGGSSTANSTNAATAVNLTAKQRALYKKRPSGRIHKWMGDLSLQVSSPLDAIEHYIAAIVECRSLQDGLWLAAALEGYATAILLLHHMRPDLLDTVIGKDLKTVSQPKIIRDPDDESDDEDDGGQATGDSHANDNMTSDASGGKKKWKKGYVEPVFLLAEERAHEALSFYASFLAFKSMELECSFRLVKFFQHPSNQHPMKLQKMVDYLMRAVSIPSLSPKQSLDAILQAAAIFQQLHFYRKQALLCYIGSLMAMEQNHHQLACALVSHHNHHNNHIYYHHIYHVYFSIMCYICLDGTSCTTIWCQVFSY